MSWHLRGCVFLHCRFCSADLIFFRLRRLQPYPMEKNVSHYFVWQNVCIYYPVTDDSAKYSWTYRCLARNSGCGISGSFCVGLLSVDKTEKIWVSVIG